MPGKEITHTTPSHVLSKLQLNKRPLDLREKSKKYLPEVEALIANKNKLSLEAVEEKKRVLEEKWKDFDRPTDEELRTKTAYQNVKYESQDERYLAIVTDASRIVYRTKKARDMKKDSKDDKFVCTEAYWPEANGEKPDRNSNAAFILAGIEKGRSFRVYHTLDLILERVAQQIYDPEGGGLGGAFTDLIWILYHYDLKVDQNGLIIASPIDLSTTPTMSEIDIKEEQKSVLPKISQKRYTFAQATEWMANLMYYWNEKFTMEDRWRAKQAWANEMLSAQQIVKDKLYLISQNYQIDLMIYENSIKLAKSILEVQSVRTEIDHEIEKVREKDLSHRIDTLVDSRLQNESLQTEIIRLKNKRNKLRLLRAELQELNEEEEDKSGNHLSNLKKSLAPDYLEKMRLAKSNMHAAFKKVFKELKEKKEFGISDEKSRKLDTLLLPYSFDDFNFKCFDEFWEKIQRIFDGARDAHQENNSTKENYYKDQFKLLIKFLVDDAGIPFEKNNKIALWSSELSRETAAKFSKENGASTNFSAQTYLRRLLDKEKDGEKIISILADIVRDPNVYPELWKLFWVAMSEFFVENVKPGSEVHVFFQDVIMAHNFVWNSELPVLRAKGAQIIFHRYHLDKDKSFIANMDSEQARTLPLIRRDVHPEDITEKLVTKENVLTLGNKKVWRQDFLDGKLVFSYAPHIFSLGKFCNTTYKWAKKVFPNRKFEKLEYKSFCSVVPNSIFHNNILELKETIDVAKNLGNSKAQQLWDKNWGLVRNDLVYKVRHK